MSITLYVSGLNDLNRLQVVVVVPQTTSHMPAIYSTSTCGYGHPNGD